MWSVPQCTGVPPAPCAAFSFNKIDHHHALLFGGRQCAGRVNELHILNMDRWVCHYCGVEMEWYRDALMHRDARCVNVCTDAVN